MKSEDLDIKIIARGNCVVCGRELTDSIFLCKDCQKANEKFYAALRKEEVNERIVDVR